MFESEEEHEINSDGEGHPNKSFLIVSTVDGAMTISKDNAIIKEEENKVLFKPDNISNIHPEKVHIPTFSAKATKNGNKSERGSYIIREVERYSKVVKNDNIYPPEEGINLPYYEIIFQD